MKPVLNPSHSFKQTYSLYYYIPFQNYVFIYYLVLEISLIFFIVTFSQSNEQCVLKSQQKILTFTRLHSSNNTFLLDY